MEGRGLAVLPDVVGNELWMEREREERSTLVQDSTCLGRECVRWGSTRPCPPLPFGPCHWCPHGGILALHALGDRKAA